MIFPTVLFLIAVAALVGLLHVTSLPSQIVLAFWVLLLTIGATHASTDESVAKRREQRARASTTKAEG